MGNSHIFTADYSRGCASAYAGVDSLYTTEAEFMNVQYNFAEVFGHNLENSQT
jgi:hypothetical protein